STRLSKPLSCACRRNLVVPAAVIAQHSFGLTLARKCCESKRLTPVAPIGSLRMPKSKLLPLRAFGHNVCPYVLSHAICSLFTSESTCAGTPRLVDGCL